MRKSKFFKLMVLVISVILVIDMVRPYSAYSEEAGRSTHYVGYKTALPVKTGPENIVLPARLGCIDNVYRGSSSRMVFHIKDAHCNYDAQKKINDLIEWIIEKYGVTLVNLEGGSGRYDLSIIEDIKEESVKANISDKYLANGNINGAEFYRIFNPDKVELAGIEDPGLYEQNLTAYRSVLSNKREMEDFIRIAIYTLDGLAEGVFSETLETFRENRFLFDSNKIALNDYSAYLIGVIDACSLRDRYEWTNLRAMLQLYEKEDGIDFETAEKERIEVIQQLTKRLSRYERLCLIDRIQQFGEGNLSGNMFHKFLIRKCREISIDETGYIHLLRYMEYLADYERIDRSRLFSEIRDAEEALGKVLCENAEEKKILQYMVQMHLLKKMFDLRVQREELDLARKTVDLSGFLTFIREYAVSGEICDKLDALSVYASHGFSNMLVFYGLSETRDNVFVRKITENMDKKGVRTSIIVTGGFHSENLHRIMRERNISYVSINPAFTNEPDYISPYMKLLAGVDETSYAGIYSLLVSNIQLQSLWSELSNNNFLETLALKIRAMVDIEIEKGVPEILVHITDGKKMFFTEKMGYKPILWNPVYSAGSEQRREISAGELMTEIAFDGGDFEAAASNAEQAKDSDEFREKMKLLDLLKSDIKQSRYGPARLMRKTAYILREDGRIIEQNVMGLPNVDTYVFDYDIREKRLVCRESSAKTISGYMLHPGRVKGDNEKYYLCRTLSRYFNPGISEKEQRQILLDLMKEQTQYELQEECGWKWNVDRDEDGNILVNRKEGLGLKGLHIFDRTKLPDGIGVPTLTADAQSHGGTQNVQELHYEVDLKQGNKVRIRHTASWSAIQKMTNLQDIAYRDQLTGAHNRHFFYDQVEPSIAASVPLSILFIDADHFKRFNDTYQGKHAFGDMILRTITGALKTSVRKEDIVIRWGGEEFVIILMNTAAEEAKTVAKKIRENIREQRPRLLLEDGGQAGLREDDEISVTIGIMEVRSAGEAETIGYSIDKADGIMMEAKQAGRRGRIFIVGETSGWNDIAESPENDRGGGKILFTPEGYYWEYEGRGGTVIKFPSFLHLVFLKAKALKEDRIFTRKFDRVKDLVSELLERVQKIFESEINGDFEEKLLTEEALQLVVKAVMGIKKTDGVEGSVSGIGSIGDWLSALILRFNRFPAEARIVVYPVYSETAFAKEVEMVRNMRKRLTKNDYGFDLIPLPYLSGDMKSRGEVMRKMRELVEQQKDARALVFGEPAFFKWNDEEFREHYGDRVLCVKEEGISSGMEEFTYLAFNLRASLALAVIDYFDGRNKFKQEHKARLKDMIAALLVVITGDEDILKVFNEDPENLIKGLIVVKPAERIAWEEVGAKVELARQFLRSL